jgi:hypothetical protein
MMSSIEVDSESTNITPAEDTFRSIFTKAPSIEDYCPQIGAQDEYRRKFEALIDSWDDMLKV